MSMLPSELTSAFNQISTVPISTFHYWIQFIAGALMVLLSIVVIAMAMYQLNGSGEIDISTFILLLSGLLIGLVLFISLLAV